MTDKERLYAKITRQGSSDRLKAEETCFLFTGGALDKDGYGRFSYQGRTQTAHRVSYELEYGPIPEGLVVRHAPGCARHCVNPRHLRLGTQQENVEDREREGKTARGVRNGRAKLDEDTVRTIRHAVDRGAVQAELARRYGVDRTVIRDVVHRRTWRHIE